MDINNGIVDSASTWITTGSVNGKESGIYTFSCKIKAPSYFDDEPMQDINFSFDVPEGMETGEEMIAWGENQVLQAIVDAINNQEYKKETTDGLDEESK